jgi:hypothetical protein
MANSMNKLIWIWSCSLRRYSNPELKSEIAPCSKSNTLALNAPVKPHCAQYGDIASSTRGSRFGSHDSGASFLDDHPPLIAPQASQLIFRQAYFVIF